MSHLHLNVQCLERWQSVCTASTDSKSKKTWWEWSKLKYKVRYEVGNLCFGGVLSQLRRTWPGMRHSQWVASLPKLTSLKSKHVILDWIADLSCAWTSIIRQIIGQDIPSSERSSFTMNTRAMSQTPRPGHADLRCARTTMIFLHKLQCCHE